MAGLGPRPLRATLPVASLTRRRPAPAPDRDLPTVRSPGAIDYGGKSKTLSGRCPHEFTSSIVMRRTASLDTIYITGQWPRETLYLYASNLQVDRSTQTDDWLGEVRRNQRYQDLQSNEDKLEKYIRHRRCGREASSRERTAAFTLLGGGGGEVCGHKTRMRSSIEGLNQEIEKLVLRSSSSHTPDWWTGLGPHERKGVVGGTPEGHRAPVADLLRQTRSVNTQTPAPSYQTSGPPSRDSGSPLVSNNIDSRPSSELQGGCSEDSSPEHEGRGLGTSPRINRFLAREPPDGCERVNLKFTDDARKPMVDISEMDYPLKPSMNFQLKPSLGSAFHPPRPLPQPTTQ